MLIPKTLRENTDLRELTPAIVNSLIRRAEVYNNEKSAGGHGKVKSDNYITAVGMVDIPAGKKIPVIWKI